MFTLTHATHTTHIPHTDDIQPSSSLINMPMVDYPDTLTYTTSDEQYHAKIITPKYFSAAGYIDYLRDSLDKIKFVDQRAVYEMVNLPMVKVIKEVTLADLQARIEQLEARIAACTDDGYECIEIHEYPSWATYEEFKKLPGWKYFEAAENYKSHVLMQDSSNPARISIKNREIKKLAVCFDNHDKLDFNEFCRTKHGMPINYGYIAELHYFSDKLFVQSIIADKHQGTYHVTFAQNVTLFIPNPIRPHIFYPAFLYVKKYVIGWFLLNTDLFDERKSYVIIDIKQNNLKIKIFTSIKKYYFIEAATKLIYLPKLKEIIINGSIFEIIE